MNTKDFIRLGVPLGEPVQIAHEFIQNFVAQGNDGAKLEAEVFNIVANPPAFFADELRAPLARAIYRAAFTPREELPLRRLRSHRSVDGREALPRSAFAPWRQWGEGLEAEAVKQMANAYALPSRPSTNPHFSPPPPRRWRVRSCRMRTSATACRSAACSRRTARDCRSGGYAVTTPRLEVCATARGVPYAVGVDIAYRMKLIVYDRKANTLVGQRDRLARIIDEDDSGFPYA